MDKFKFRVWDKEDKKFLDHLSIALSADGILILWRLEGKKYINLNDNNRYLLIQCTGLKDKNGKLIYEGDIVKYHYDWEDEIKPVFFDTISACYGVKICKDFILPFTNGLDNIEVIGNIHQNSELLNDNK